MDCRSWPDRSAVTKNATPPTMNQGFHKAKLQRVWDGPTAVAMPAVSDRSTSSTTTPRTNKAAPTNDGRRRAAVPVVPAVVDGSFFAWPKGRLLPTRAPVRRGR